MSIKPGIYVHNESANILHIDNKGNVTAITDDGIEPAYESAEEMAAGSTRINPIRETPWKEADK